MNNKDKVLKLAEEAKNLIIEFRNEASVLGENPLNDINISEDGFKITKIVIGQELKNIHYLIYHQLFMTIWNVGDQLHQLFTSV